MPQSEPNQFASHRTCPRNGKRYPTVSTFTLRHHLREPWRRDLQQHHYYCCDDPDCDVVYFNEADELLLTGDSFLFNTWAKFRIWLSSLLTYAY